MLKWIRWPGFIAFVAILALLFAFTYFFTGLFIKNAIEEYGSDALGAQVNVDSVNLTLDPLGFRIGRVQVTNPEEPMTNAVEIKGAAFEVDFWRLFMGQFIVNELSVETLQFNTARKSSGAIAKKVKPKDEKPGKMAEVLETAKDELPSADEIMSRETLLTDVKSAELQTLYEQKTKELDAMKAGLMSSQQLKDYQDEIKTLTSEDLKSLEDFNQRKKRLSEINDELKKEKQKITELKTAYSTAYKELNQKLSEVKDAPSQDLKNLKNKYSLDAGGAANLTQLLFGGQTGEWTKQALYWYEKAQPYLASAESTKPEEKKIPRAEGRFVHFGGVEMLPEFLLREARIDVLLAAGHLDANVTNITHQPEVLGKPVRLLVSGTELQGYDSITLNAEFNHIDPKNSFDRADLKIKAMEFKDFTVSGSSEFPLKLATAKTDINSQIVVRKGAMDLAVQALFADAQFKSGAKSGVAKQVGELLEDIHHFEINFAARGKLNDLDTSLNTSLEKQLKAALEAKVDAKKAQLEAELKAKLQARVTEKAGSYGKELEALLSSEGDMEAKQQQLEAMAKAKLSSWEEQQKKELEAKKAAEKKKAEDKVRDALKDKFKF